ncbi:ATP-binding protein [Actinoplanes solisilvae]|uniref:ATP-binding protein n=1 Tax=Actinoplanes solisilvae TaxID=2486853 RepID=UPI000FD96BCA|nr:ATP-binding protein [Actinoplanes solisilvae]
MDLLSVPFELSTDYAVLRRHARETLSRWQEPPLVEDALLVITELVENVVQHTGKGGELVLRRLADVVRIEVHDTSPEMPRSLGPDPRRIGGRGLLLVGAMTRAWGTDPHEMGKSVWADVARAE